MMSAAESDLEDNVFLGDPMEPQRAGWKQEDGAARHRAGSLCLNQHQHDTSDDLSAPPLPPSPRLDVNQPSHRPTLQ